jgi:hypothetical protein
MDNEKLLDEYAERIVKEVEDIDYDTLKDLVIDGAKFYESLPIYTLISVTYDYYRFESFIMTSTNKNDLLKEVDRINNSTNDKKEQLPVLEYEPIKINKPYENPFYKIDELDSGNNHFWISKK